MSTMAFPLDWGGNSNIPGDPAQARLCYERPMTALKWLLVLAVAGYGGLLTLMYVFQRALMYFPDATRCRPGTGRAAAGAGSYAHQPRWRTSDRLVCRAALKLSRS